MLGVPSLLAAPTGPNATCTPALWLLGLPALTTFTRTNLVIELNAFSRPRAPFSEWL